MKKAFFLIFACLAAFTVSAKVERNYSSKAIASEGETFHVDSVDYRTDLTRVYGQLMGQPHTSGRIDAVEIESGGRKFVADDIDGVDFKRYYQYEDEGVIPLEIDFPAMKPFEGAVMIFTSPHFQQTTRVSRRSK